MSETQRAINEAKVYSNDIWGIFCVLAEVAISLAEIADILRGLKGK